MKFSKFYCQCLLWLYRFCMILFKSSLYKSAIRFSLRDILVLFKHWILKHESKTFETDLLSIKKIISSKYSFRMHSYHHWLFFYLNKNKSACKLNVLSLGESEPAFQLKTIGKQKLKKTQVIEINMNFYKNFMKLNYSNDR